MPRTPNSNVLPNQDEHDPSSSGLDKELLDAMNSSGLDKELLDAINDAIKSSGLDKELLGAINQGLLDAINNNKRSPTTRSAASSKSKEDWSSATQELLDALPQVWTRGLLYLLVVFAGVVVPWAAFSKVEETGTARGRLEPKGATQRLDAPVAGTVTQVRVKEGQTVKAGQVLMELESDLLRNELQQSQTKLEGQLDRLARLELSKNQLKTAIQVQQQQNQAQALEKLAQVKQAQESLGAAKTAYTLADSRFAKDQAQIQRYRQFSQQGIIPRVQVFETERQVDESQRLQAQALADIQQAVFRLKEQQGGYQSITRTGELAVLKSKEQLEDLKTQTTALQVEITQSKSEIKSLQLQLRQRVFRAPVGGRIFQLPTSKAEAVVQPGQLVARIAPQGSTLVLKAEIPSQESGFLRVGMPVKLKFDAYPFQDYGIVQGHLRSISPDSKVVETAQGKVEAFELEIALDQLYIQTSSKRIALTPGQTATAEVIVRQRHVIDFILDPFKKLQKSGLEF